MAQNAINNDPAISAKHNGSELLSTSFTYTLEPFLHHMIVFQPRKNWESSCQCNAITCQIWHHAVTQSTMPLGI